MIPAEVAQLELEQIYRRHGHLVLRRARQILGSDQEAHEALQEIFTSLLHRPEQFEGRSQITTWLYSATTHLCLNRLRNHSTRTRILTEKVAPVDASASVESNAEARAHVRQILSRVPEELARVAVYYYLDDLSHREIAELVGCSRRHVGDLLVRFHEAAREVERGR